MGAMPSYHVKGFSHGLSMPLLAMLVSLLYLVHVPSPSSMLRRVQFEADLEILSRARPLTLDYPRVQTFTSRLCVWLTFVIFVFRRCILLRMTFDR